MNIALIFSFLILKCLINKDTSEFGCFSSIIHVYLIKTKILMIKTIFNFTENFNIVLSLVISHYYYFI